MALLSSSTFQNSAQGKWENKVGKLSQGKRLIDFTVVTCEAMALDVPDCSDIPFHQTM